MLVLLCSLAAAPSVRAAEEQVNFGNLGDDAVPSLTIDSLTVTGSDQINISQGLGLGIVGGGVPLPFFGNSTVDPGETMTFQFASPATNIRIISLFGCNILDKDGDGVRLDVLLTAYNSSGTELKTVGISSTNCLIDMSAELAVAPISRIDFTVVKDAITIPGIAFETGGSAVPEYFCNGFKPPFHRDAKLRKRTRGAVPVKMVLTAGDESVIGDDDVTALPVINVSSASGVVNAASRGKANDSDAFRYDADDGQWIYNLDTSGLAEPGVYTVSVSSGDVGEYTIDTSDACTQTIERLP